MDLSILTKICVVLLAVLVAVACPVFISHATVTAKWKVACESAQAENESIRQATQQKGLALTASNAENKQLRTALDKLRNESTAQAKASQLEVARLQTLIANYVSTIKSMAADSTIKSAVLDDTNKRNEANSKQGKLYRDEINRKAEEVNRLSFILKEAQSKLTRAEKASRIKEEKIVELQQREQELLVTVKELMRSGAKLGSGDQVVAADRDLVGRVLAVRGGIASINIGSANGVTRGMMLVITRDNDYVGKLRIAEVSASEAGGMIVDKRLVAQAGDVVKSGGK